MNARHILRDNVLNVTDTLTGSFEVVLQAAIPTFLNIAVWIAVVVVLALIVIGTIRLVGWATGLPTGKIFECAKALVEQKIEQVKENKNGKQKPFILSMFGITIMAEGLTGRIMFIALLGSIAAAGAGITSSIEQLYTYDAFLAPSG